MTAALHPRRFAAARSRAIAFVALLVAGCSAPSIDAPFAPSEPAAARGGGGGAGPTVTSTNPGYGDRGTTLDVRILGSGFTAGAQATWLLDGVANPAHVRTNSTTYVSSTELVANITIESDAELDYWDVQVALAGGKNGVGTESFEVTTAQALGVAAFVYDGSETGQVAGYNTNAFVYDPDFGMLSLGSGQAWGLDPLGTLVVGRVGSTPSAWVRVGTSSTYMVVTLPLSAGKTGGNASKVARDATGALLIGGWENAPAKKGGAVSNRPILWRYDGSWSAPLVYALPAGSTSASTRGINGLGQTVGRIDASTVGAVWDTPTTPVKLDGMPNSINSTGTFIVGARGTTPVFWTRSTTGAWDTVGVALPSLGGTCGGEAIGLNDDGVVVGSSCDVRGNRNAAIWRVDLSVTPAAVTGPQRLPGLGVKHGPDTNESSSAVSVTSVAPYTVVGIASAQNGAQAVRWLTW